LGKKTLLDFLLFGLLLIAFIPVVTLIYSYVPISPWYNIGNLSVENDPVPRGGKVELEYDGGPKVPFRGSYSVTIRDATSGEIIAEGRGGPFGYKPGSKRPDPLFLTWWLPSDPRVAEITKRPGAYYIETCWTAHDVILWVFDVTDCLEHNARFGVRAF